MKVCICIHLKKENGMITMSLLSWLIHLNSETAVSPVHKSDNVSFAGFFVCFED